MGSCSGEGAGGGGAIVVEEFVVDDDEILSFVSFSRLPVIECNISSKSLYDIFLQCKPG